MSLEISFEKGRETLNGHFFQTDIGIQGGSTAITFWQARKG
jgi:hypothetical protein